MSLLLQLYADLPDKFPAHERRLYVFGCRRKACRRKEGSTRAIRAVRTGEVESEVDAGARQDGETLDGGANEKPAMNIGETLFGVKSPTPAQANPFAMAPGPSSGGNPFSTAKSVNTQPAASTQQPTTNDLSETFAANARISTPSTQSAPPVPRELWPRDPTSYPSYHLEADKEYLYPNTDSVPQVTRLDPDAEGGPGASDDNVAFESAMDKTFQHFADRLAQNPEQVLRYEHGGEPLLYSRSDIVGKMLSSTVSESKIQTTSSFSQFRGSNPSKLPRCAACGATRVFELQLTPHAIAELEVDEMGIDGMDWGTIVVGVCGEDCQEQGKKEGEVGYVEEWIGVQWEEIVADGKKR